MIKRGMKGGSSFMTKKAQAEIIVTILIILLVLAAVVIVWQVVQSTVTQGAQQIPGQTDCLTTNLDIITPVYNDTKLKIRRGIGAGDITGIVIMINDTNMAEEAILIKELESKETGYDIPTWCGVTNACKIKIAKKIGDRLCDYAGNSVDGVIVQDQP